MNKDNGRLRTASLIAKNLIILAVVVVAAFIGIFAWFSSNPNATASGISVKTEIPDGLEVAVVKTGTTPENYTNTSITLDNTTYPEIISEEFMFSDITGDGKIDSQGNTNLWVPSITQSGGIASVDPYGEATNATAGAHYLSFDIYFRSKNKYIVSLDSDTSVTPSSAITADSYKDGVIGSLRMAIPNCNASDSNSYFLWVPAPKLYYDRTTKLMDLTHSGEPTLDGNTPIHYYYDKNSSDAITGDDDSVLYKHKITATVDDTTTEDSASTGFRLGTDTQIAKLDTKDDDSDYYTSHVTVNIWTEGEDNESSKVFVGGKFSIYLDLTATEIK